MKLVVAMLKHETNSFSPLVTDLARFEAWGVQRGPAVVDAYGATAMPIGAYLRAARARGAEVVTPLAAEAMPGGLVTEAAYEALVGPIVEAVAAGCDGVLLDLHGALMAAHTDDGEGTLLARLRAVAPDLPIAVTCDLHCNLSAAMVANCSALIGYKSYPHVDMAERGAQVAAILFDQLAGGAPPAMAWGRLPLLAQTLRMGTDDAPMAGLMARARALEATGVRAATLFGGFPMADQPGAGVAAVAVATHRDQAQEAVDRLLGAAWAAREQFVYRPRPLAQALDAAARLGASGGPVILLDHADNCGSGGTQDVMGVLAAVLDRGLDNVAMAAVWDPAAVAVLVRAGRGARVTLALGGRTDMPALGLAGQPLTVTGTVAALGDGRFTVEGPMYTGVMVEMGPSAVLDTGRVRIVIVSRHHEPWDTGVFTSLGIDPAAQRFLLLKSRIHYRAGFARLAKATVTLDGAGVTTSDNGVLRYRRLRRPIYPLDAVPDDAPGQ